MPTICAFYGIVIQMYWADHGPPHFHALYAEHEALIAIETLEVLQASYLEELSHWFLNGQPSIERN